MHRTVSMTAIALLFGTAAVAQDTQQQTEQQQPGEQQAMAGDGLIEAQDGDVFATRLIGIMVMAPASADAQAAFEGVEDHAIDSAQLADFASVGTVSDVLMTMEGEPRGIVISLAAQADGTATDQAATPPPAAQPGEPAPDQAPGTGPGMATVPGAGAMGPEIAVEVGSFRIFSDINAPDMLFAVVDAPWEELQQAPMIERQLAMGGTGPAAAAPVDEPGLRGWTMGRQPMAAPGVAVDGFQAVPVAEVPLDDLVGAPVYGTEMEQIGSIGDVMLGPDGQAEYVLVDVGGFLGIGTRQVAIGFEEMTVLHDEGWDDLQVHVGATREAVEDLPEYEAN
jgi:hypothetical protein